MSSYENQSLPASRDDAALLLECAEFASLSEHPAWGKIVLLMESLVAEALTDMRSNLSSDDALRSRLMWRWQQREAMMICVLDFIAGFHQQRQRIIEEMEHERDDSEPAGYSSYVHD